MTSSSSIGMGMDEEEERPHVLAVDDSLVDRKLIETLLTKSACKGIFFFFYFFPLYIVFFIINK